MGGMRMGGMRMARRSNKALPVVALFEAIAMLPWWLGVVGAIVAYAGLHWLADPANVREAAAPGRTALGAVARQLASVGQYVVPALLLAGAAASAFGQMSRQRLVRSVALDTDGAALRSMSWQQFERLVGEAFRMQGYAVVETGMAGPDGGIDLKLTRNGETFLVQCKHWRAFKVSVNVVRELYGVMASRAAAGGFVVTSGRFTPQAEEFARDHGIELIDGPALDRMLEPVRRAHGPRADADQPPTKG